jgi:putative NIF3 family GTP cyclohydrolase 1 type 2
VRFTAELTIESLTLLVLLEAPFDPLRRQKNSVLLTVDLTKAVADEAIERRDSVVIAYRELTATPGIH